MDHEETYKIQQEVRYDVINNTYKLVNRNIEITSEEVEAIIGCNRVVKAREIVDEVMRNVGKKYGVINPVNKEEV